MIAHGSTGRVPGVTGHLAIHLQEPDDRKKVPEFHEVFIEIGVASRAEAGQPVRFLPIFVQSGGIPTMWIGLPKETLNTWWWSESMRAAINGRGVTIGLPLPSGTFPPQTSTQLLRKTG